MSKYEPASELCSPENTPQSWGPLGLQVPVLSPPLSPSKEFHTEGILQQLHQLALPPGGPSESKPMVRLKYRTSSSPEIPTLKEFLQIKS